MRKLEFVVLVLSLVVFVCATGCGHSSIIGEEIASPVQSSVSSMQNISESNKPESELSINSDVTELEVIPDKLVYDFFSDLERQTTYKDLYTSYQYQNLYDYVNNYISSENPVAEDSAFGIIDLIEPLLGYESDWIINHDDFDNTYAVSFDGANAISDTCSVSAHVKNTSFETEFGFVKSGWLFFDSIQISADGDQIYSASTKKHVNRDVVSGGIIKESTLSNLYDDVIEKLRMADVAILRFYNTDTKEYYDHTFTCEEQDALYCGLHLQRNNRDLSNLLYRYNKKHQ